jgi:hypothetical protein
MTTILEIFGGLELLVLVLSVIGLFVYKELEMLLPIWFFFRATAVLTVVFLVVTVVHDHVHIHISTG